MRFLLTAIVTACPVFGLCIVTALTVCPAGLAHTAEAPQPGMVSVGIKIGTATRDVLSIGDIRPTPRGEVVGDASVTVELPRKWQGCVGSRIGGSWLTFRQPLGASGNIKDQSWIVYAGLDRWVTQSPKLSVSIGAVGEYGEARSWTDTRLYSQEGAKTFLSGGEARIGLLTRLGAWADFQGEIGQAVFHAHAHDPLTKSDFDWLGRSLALAVGVRVKIWQQ